MERVTTFEVPESIAKRLSELLIKERVRKQLLAESVNDPSRFDELENLVIIIVSEIDKIKHDITTLYVPNEYRSEDYIWDYNGYEIDKNHFTIYKA